MSAAMGDGCNDPQTAQCHLNAMFFLRNIDVLLKPDGSY